MAIGLWRKWREERLLQRRAAAYVRHLEREPAETDVRWLASEATRGDLDHALWELRYARRALGLLVAERDALDDRTASAVAHALQEALGRDPHVASAKLDVARQQLNSRLRAYGEVLQHRVPGVTSGERLGRTLIGFAGALPTGPLVARGGELLAGYVADANEALRREFGVASLPEDLPPSAVQGARVG
jgi:hypothetical protein